MAITRLTRSFALQAVAMLIAATAAVVTNPQPASAEPKDLLKTPLGFKIEDADRALGDRSWAVTSPHLDNRAGYHFGLGKAKQGLIWGNFYVSFETSTSLTLRARTTTRNLDKHDVFLQVSGLRWDKDKQVYHGQAVFWGRSHKQCPRSAHPSPVTVRIWRTHPFQGALLSIEGKPMDWKENSKCQRIGAPYEKAVSIGRTFTTVETIRAVEQAEKIWNGRIHDLHAQVSHIRRRRPRMPDEVYKQLQKDMDKVDQTIEEVEHLFSDVNWALKFGGTVRKNGKRYEHRTGLQPAESALFMYTGQLMTTAVQLPQTIERAKAKADKLDETWN